MIWNGTSNEERLRLWKNLREEIKDKTKEEKIEEISRFFANMPFGSRTIDYYSPNEWPTPWEILYYGTFCTSSISLLIFYTIILVCPDCKIDLILVDDETDVYLLPLVDDQNVLNYHLGLVSKYHDIQNDFDIIKRFPSGQVKIIT